MMIPHIGDQQVLTLKKFGRLLDIQEGHLEVVNIWIPASNGRVTHPPNTL
jgi:hypothetical protein